MKIKYIYFILWLALISIICIGSLSPSLAPPGKLHMDKVFHLGANFLLALYPLYLCRTKLAYYCATIFVIMFGVLIEIIQQNVPGREASLGDVLANSVGVLIALILVLIVKKKFLKTHKKRRKIEP